MIVLGLFSTTACIPKSIKLCKVTRFIEFSTKMAKNRGFPKFWFEIQKNFLSIFLKHFFAIIHTYTITSFGWLTFWLLLRLLGHWHSQSPMLGPSEKRQAQQVKHATDTRLTFRATKIIRNSPCSVSKARNREQAGLHSSFISFFCCHWTYNSPFPKTPEKDFQRKNIFKLDIFASKHFLAHSESISTKIFFEKNQIFIHFLSFLDPKMAF